MSEDKDPRPRPGEIIPWEEKLKEYEKIVGDPEIVRSQWELLEQLANRFIYFCLTDM